MSLKAVTPSGLHAPFGRYAHGVEIPAGYRMLRSSGQLAMTPEGDIPDGAFAQATLCFANIARILEAADFGPQDVVHISGFVTERAHFMDYMRARDAFMTGVDRHPASTLLIVGGFTRAEFLVEVEVMAAAP